MSTTTQQSTPPTNFWLIDPEFHKRAAFHDAYYFEKLCTEIDRFLRTLPIPVVSSWDYKHKSIYFRIGSAKQYFPVSIDIDYADFLYAVHRWIRNYFPQCSHLQIVRRPPTEEEIYEGIQKGEFSVEQIADVEIEEEYKHHYIIESVDIVNDEFVLIEDGEKKSKRLTKKPLSIFMREIRAIPKENDEEIYNYLTKFSIQTKYLKETREVVEIPHKGNRLINFFLIRKDDIMKSEVVQFPEDPLKAQFGLYIVKFESKAHMNECKQMLLADSPKLVLSDNVFAHRLY